MDGWTEKDPIDELVPEEWWEESTMEKVLPWLQQKYEHARIAPQWVLIKFLHMIKEKEDLQLAVKGLDIFSDKTTYVRVGVG